MKLVLVVELSLPKYPEEIALSDDTPFLFRIELLMAQGTVVFHSVCNHNLDFLIVCLLPAILYAL